MKGNCSSSGAEGAGGDGGNDGQGGDDNPGAGGATGTGGRSGAAGSSGDRGSALAGSMGTGGLSGAGGQSSNAGASGTGGKSGTGGRSGAGGTSGSAGAMGTAGTMGTAGSAGQAGRATPVAGCDNFSFFVTSLAAIQRESKSTNGYGGNLGGLAGADEICLRIAEASLACAGQKEWRAFLSTSTVNAIDRVGPGPWYDRLGRVVAKTPSDLTQTRPANADTAIINDLPNEDGTPNHNPDNTGKVDNHDTLTGSNSQGKLYGAAQSTCDDWTSTTTANGKPRVGHSWPGGPSQHWMNAMDAPGCAAGVNLSSAMGSTGQCVGCGGGYGGFYCFATTP